MPKTLLAVLAHPDDESLGFGGTLANYASEGVAPATTWAAYAAAFTRLAATVDGVQRQATAWPDWAITTMIDTRRVWPTVWRAVSCHESQMAAYALWGSQSFYRACSMVSGGRARETDLFEGISG